MATLAEKYANPATTVLTRPLLLVPKPWRFCQSQSIKRWNGRFPGIRIKYLRISQRKRSNPHSFHLI